MKIAPRLLQTESVLHRMQEVFTERVSPGRGASPCQGIRESPVLDSDQKLTPQQGELNTREHVTAI